MSIILLSLALLVQMHVSHISQWHACAYSVHKFFSLYKIEYYSINSTHSFTHVLVGHMYFGVHYLAHSSCLLHVSHEQEQNS